MKYAVKIDNVDVLLDQERLDQLIDLLVGTEKLAQEYVGNKKGDDGTNYITLVRPYTSHVELHHPVPARRYVHSTQDGHRGP